MLNKKVLHIIGKLNVGGAENVLVTLVNILHERDVDVAVLSILDKGDLSDFINKDIPQYFLNRTNKFSLRYLRKLYNIVKQYDIVHVHSHHNLRYVSLCKLLHLRRFPKLVFHDHSPYIADNIIFKLIKSEIDVYISVCNRNAEWASKEMNISKTFTLPNIVKRLKTEEIKPDKDYVLVGNVSPQKNYEFLIDFSTAFNNEQFDIYYGGYSSEEYLNELIADKTENINFIYGEKNIQQIIKRYKMALHCAHAESGPLVLIEYLAQGVPFITYNTGEVVAQIKKDLPEFIVNSFNKDEWIMAINRINELINEDIESLKLRIKKVYEDNFSEEKYFEKCLKIYKSV